MTKALDLPGVCFRLSLPPREKHVKLVKQSNKGGKKSKDMHQELQRAKEEKRKTKIHEKTKQNHLAHLAGKENNRHQPRAKGHKK